MFVAVSRVDNPVNRVPLILIDEVSIKVSKSVAFPILMFGAEIFARPVLF